MAEQRTRGYCLNSQQIRQRIQEGEIVTPGKPEEYERRIQATSLDLICSDEVFFIDSEAAGIIHPVGDEQVYRTLLRTLPPSQRKRIDTSSGYEVRVGFWYAIKLLDRLSLREGERLKFSQKSTFAREFLEARLMIDYSPCFNEAVHEYSGGKLMDVWLYVRPENFNLILHAGESLGQVTFFSGDARLSAAEIRKLYKKIPVLYLEDEAYQSKGPDDERLLVAPHIIGENGLLMHADARGRANSGVVALRAKSNPNPIDCSKTGYNVDDYFDPIVAEDLPRLRIRSRVDKVLMRSKEVVKIPADVCAELETHPDKGMLGRRVCWGGLTGRLRLDPGLMAT